MRLGPLGLYRISGGSMEPDYRSGDLVLGRRWFTPKAGQVVIMKTPERLIVKRIKRLEPGQIWLEGDNAAASTDSRSKGLYSADELEALVVAKF